MARWALWVGLFIIGCGTPFGIYHDVRSGQTLYRISKVYGVDIDRVLRLNRIEDPTKLQPGDRVFIPGADRQRYVPTTIDIQKAQQNPKPQRPKPSVPAPKKASPKSTAKSEIRLLWPTKGVVTSVFGQRDGRPHDGIDIGGPIGQDIIAAQDGRVIYSDNKLKGYGNLIIVRHQSCWATVYAHNDKNLVSQGDFVSAGQVIAKLGQTGRATGPHLHFEVRCGKVAKNPMPFLDKNAS